MYTTRGLLEEMHKILVNFFMVVCLKCKTDHFFVKLMLGPVDPSKTQFIDQTAVVIVTKGLYSAIRVIPKDSFGNLATISQKELTVEINKVKY